MEDLLREVNKTMPCFWVLRFGWMLQSWQYIFPQLSLKKPDLYRSGITEGALFMLWWRNRLGVTWKREMASHNLFLIPGIWHDLRSILCCISRSTRGRTIFIMTGFFEELVCLLIISTTPSLSEWNKMEWFFSLLPNVPMRARIGYNSNTVMPISLSSNTFCHKCG